MIVCRGCFPVTFSTPSPILRRIRKPNGLRFDLLRLTLAVIQPVIRVVLSRAYNSFVAINAYVMLGVLFHHD